MTPEQQQQQGQRLQCMIDKTVLTTNLRRCRIEYFSTSDKKIEARALFFYFIYRFATDALSNRHKNKSN